MTTRDSWAIRFIELRKRIGSQEHFADTYKIPRRTVSRWETGRNKPDEEYRGLLAGINDDFAELIDELPEDGDLAALREDLAEVLRLVKRALELLEARAA